MKNINQLGNKLESLRIETIGMFNEPEVELTKINDCLGQYQLSIDSTIEDVTRHFNGTYHAEEAYHSDYKKALEINGTDEIAFIKQRIQEDNNNYSYYELVEHDAGRDVNQIMPLHKWRADMLAFHCAAQGLNPELSLFLNHFCKITKGKATLIKAFITNSLPQISQGVAAFKQMEQLRARLNDMAISQTQLTDQLTDEQPGPITLQTICKEEYYQQLLDQLHDEEFIDKITMTWIDKNKGVKKRINALLTVLENKGYTNDGLINPDDRCAVIENTFKIQVSRETTKKKAPENYIDDFHFIERISHK